MALVVEDGSGLANADAFVSVAFCDGYHTQQGHAAWTGADADKETAIRRATDYLSRVVTWSGYRTRGRLQSLAWPRSGCFDVEGYGIPSDHLPVEIQRACCEIALQELLTPGAFSPSVIDANAVKREKIGDLETEYANPLASASASIPAMPLVQALISPFISPGGGSSIQGHAFR